MATSNQVKKIGLYTTIAFVIANMIGTGVFTTLGFSINDSSNLVSLLILWFIGGIIALFGALVYSELGTAMPRSGGEYHYLSKIYHPYVGFLSGWVSITVGFAAPVAAACMALGVYTNGVFPSISAQFIAISIIVLITFIHSYDIKFGGNFQNIFTSFKILLILVFIISGFLLPTNFQDLKPHLQSFSFTDLFNPDMAVSLIFICYAFSGWNASAYIASEIEQPQKTIPRSLFISTLIVTVLYFFLNFIFLYTTPSAELAGNPEVGLISAKYIFGSTGGKIMGMLISILLISTISSMIFVGPRVSQVMGEDLKILKFLSFKSKHQTPVYAILIQSAISILLIITSTFKSVLIYAGFTLSLFTLITVLGIFIHRKKYKNIERPYKTWGYPVIPIIYIIIMIWILGYTFKENPLQSTLGLITVFSGSIIYFLNKKYESKPN